MVWFAVALFVAVAVILVVRRRELAEAQSLVAGGTIPPGCVVLESLAMLALAAAAIVLHRMGML